MVKKTKALDIWMNGVLVAALTKDYSGALSLQYDDSWLESDRGRPLSLSLGMQRAAHQGDGVYNFFDNLLPDNPRIRDRIQARFNAATDHPFDLLSVIGMDCVGALQILPHGSELPDVRRIDKKAISDSEIAKTLENYRTSPLGMNVEDDFRISIAGAQEKTALLHHEGRWYRPIGSTPTTHILKLPIGHIDHSNIDLSESCENEWICLKLAQELGVDANHAEIKNLDGVKALSVERFDRKRADDWIIRLPQEDLCQALGFAPARKYEVDGGPGISEIMKTLAQSQNAEGDRIQFIKSQILFWMLAAPDGHAKNFSLFIEAQGRFRMTPIYDVMSAYPLFASKQIQRKKMKLAMAFNSKNRHYRWSDVLPRHIVETFIRCHIPQAVIETAFSEMMGRVDGAIAKLQSELPEGFPSDIANPIFEGLLEKREQYERYN